MPWYAASINVRFSLLSFVGSKAKPKKASTVKPISMKDEKLLNQVIEMANEISAK